MESVANMDPLANVVSVANVDPVANVVYVTNVGPVGNVGPVNISTVFWCTFFANILVHHTCSS
jgi:hypothetical protein